LESRRAYNSFLVLLSDADPDLPVVSEAKAELAAISAPRGSHRVSDRRRY